MDRIYNAEFFISTKVAKFNFFLETGVYKNFLKVKQQNMWKNQIRIKGCKKDFGLPYKLVFGVGVTIEVLLK
jgi:hypothetical protein